MFVDGLDGLQHVLPVELPLQRFHSFAVSQPSVQIQVSALHQHVDVAAGNFTANTYDHYGICNRSHNYKQTSRACIQI